MAPLTLLAVNKVNKSVNLTKNVYGSCLIKAGLKSMNDAWLQGQAVLVFEFNCCT